MRQLFLFTSLFFILFSFKVNAEDVKKEKVYIKKVLFKPENNEKMFSIVIGCKGTTCSKNDQSYIIFVNIKDATIKEKMVLEIPEEYKNDVVGSVNLKCCNSVPLLVIAKKKDIIGLYAFMKVFTPVFMETGLDSLEKLKKLLNL